MSGSAGEFHSGPHPLSQFVLKVHGRCDLACDHCYVYEHVDQSWRQKTRAVDGATVRAAAQRIAAHAQAWRLPRVSVVLHGGEPLLLGGPGLRAVLDELRTTIAAAAPLDLVLQTNGVLLTESIADVLLEFDVRVGVSLDGDRAANDLHRRFRNGASSHAQVRRALALLRRPEYRRLYGGILCTIDVRNDPRAVYAALRIEQPPRVDFLLPHATWASPPLRPAGEATPYAAWLTTIHRLWTADGRPMRVRMFESLASTAAGGPSGSEQLGVDAADLAVIDTDGSWEQADSLKIAYAGAPETGMTVFTHSVDDVSRHPAVRQRQLGIVGLSAECQACPVVSRCGGGLFAHRFRPGNGFDNPSVYCADLKELIVRIDDSEQITSAELESAEAVRIDHLDQLATGGGDRMAVGWLADTQRTVNRALLVAVADSSSDEVTQGAWAVLTDVDRASPQAVDRVLAHPYLRPWAVAALKRPDPEPDRIAVFAAVAALYAGFETELRTSLRDGQLYLPGLGTVMLDDPYTGAGTLSTGHNGFTLRGGDQKVTVDLMAPATPWWRPAPRIAVGGIDLLIEDADPFRDCHSWPMSGALDPSEVAGWQQRVESAWQLITDESAGQVDGLLAGLRAIAPLAADPSGMKRASTARDAFGSVAASATDHAALAVMIVHEFQHSKLGAILDLYDLFDADSPVKMRVGWRHDERPVEGALQGTYAHLAVAEIWARRAARPGPDQSTAVETYRQYRDWTLAALDGLRSSRALTSLGERFVERMARTAEGWQP